MVFIQLVSHTCAILNPVGMRRKLLVTSKALQTVLNVLLVALQKRVPLALVCIIVSNSQLS